MSEPVVSHLTKAYFDATEEFKKKIQIWNLHSNISRINVTFDQMFTQIRGVRNKNQAYLDFSAHPGFFRPIRIFSVPACFLLQFPRVFLLLNLQQFKLDAFVFDFSSLLGDIDFRFRPRFRQSSVSNPI